jgi:uncharacterized DUF497 family protein
VSKLAAA